MNRIRHGTGVLGFALLIGAVLIGLVFRFAHPELTETQLFVELRWTYIPVLAGLAMMYWGVDN